jgi:glutamyl endopeptidase
MKNQIVFRVVTLLAAVLFAIALTSPAWADGPDDNKPNPARAYQSVSSAGPSKEDVARKGPTIKVVEPFQPDSLTAHRPEVDSGLEFPLNRIEDGLAPDYVFGPDNRQRISPATNYPFSAIAHLVITKSNGQTGQCTGFFIGPHTVATAGHCLYMHGAGGWATSIQVIPGRDGSQAPFGSQTVSASALRTVNGWIWYGTPAYDYGAIILPNDTLGNRVGWFGFAVWDDYTILNGLGNLSGYPEDKAWGTQWWEAEGIAQVDANEVYYYIDMIPGQSGSPVWRLVNGQRYAFAINTYQHPYYNFGTRINQSVFNLLYAWRQ